jgi:hypothetical protein
MFIKKKLVHPIIMITLDTDKIFFEHLIKKKLPFLKHEHFK